MGSKRSSNSHRRIGPAFAAPGASTSRWRAAFTTGGVSVIRTKPLYGPHSATADGLSITGSPGGQEAVQLKVAEKAVEAYSQVASDATTTLIVPSNMTEVSALIGSAMKMVQGLNEIGRAHV